MINQKDNKRHKAPQQSDKSDRYLSNTPTKEKHLADSITSNKSFTYVYKKTEKIAAALYMMSDNLSDREPMKGELRSYILDVLSQVTELGTSAGFERDTVNRRIREDVMRIISCLDIGHYAGFFSQMNRAVLRRELNALIDYLNNVDLSESSANITEDFLAVEKPQVSLGEQLESELAGDTDSYPATASASAAITGKPDRSYYSSSAPIYSGPDATSSLDPGVSRHSSDRNNNGNYGGRLSDEQAAVNRNERRAVILSLIKRKGEISVTDASSVISGCSQKTLQRELTAMVKEGVLQKKGERRWSRYSLTQ